MNPVIKKTASADTHAPDPGPNPGVEDLALAPDTDGPLAVPADAPDPGAADAPGAPGGGVPAPGTATVAPSASPEIEKKRRKSRSGLKLLQRATALPGGPEAPAGGAGGAPVDLLADLPKGSRPDHHLHEGTRRTRRKNARERRSESARETGELREDAVEKTLNAQPANEKRAKRERENERESERGRLTVRNEM